MAFPRPTSISGWIVIFFLLINTSKAQKNIEHKPAGTEIVSLHEARIYSSNGFTEKDKSVVVKILSGLEGKIISCKAYPESPFLQISYTDKIKERDILETLQMNGFDACLRKGDHIKVILTSQGEAREEFVK